MIDLLYDTNRKIFCSHACSQPNKVSETQNNLLRKIRFWNFHWYQRLQWIFWTTPYIPTHSIIQSKVQILVELYRELKKIRGA